MSAITDLADLFVTVSDHVGRGDFAHVFPQFLKLTESDLSQALRIEGNEVKATITADANGRAALPADFREVRSVRLADDTRRILAGGSLAVLDASFEEHGVPCGYAIGGGYINLRPRQSADIELTYATGVPALTADDPANGSLSMYPDCYLYGVAYRVLLWASSKGDEIATDRVASARGLLDDALTRADIDNERRTYSGAMARNFGYVP